MYTLYLIYFISLSLYEVMLLDYLIGDSEVRLDCPPRRKYQGNAWRWYMYTLYLIYFISLRLCEVMLLDYLIRDAEIG